MNRPLRVLQAIPSLDPAYGGPAAILRDLLPRLRESGVESEVVTTDAGLARGHNPRERADANLRATVHDFPRANVLGWYYAPGLCHWLERNIRRFDLVHFRSLYNYPTLAVSRAAARAAIPRLCETEGSVTPWSRSFKRWKKVPYLHLIERRNALRAEGFLVTHRVERDALLDLLPEGHGRIFDMPPPVSCPAPGVVRPPVAADELLYLSRLHTKKGLELLLDAYARLGDTVGTLRVAGSGEPAYERTLQERASRLGLADVTTFPGHLAGADKEDAFVRARLFVLPSWDENFGIAVVEAVGRGVPVVASDAVAAALELADEGFVRLFPTGDAGALAATLAEAWTDVEWHRNVADRGPAHVRQRYAPSVHAARLADAYRAIAAVGQGGA